MDPKDIFRFLTYQQFYYGNDIITDRRKLVKVRISDSGRIIDKFVNSLNEIVPKWEVDKSTFFKEIELKLTIDVSSCLKVLETNFGIQIFDKNTWTGFSEEQVLTFTFTEIFKKFYEKINKKAYVFIAKDNWNTHERRVKLADTYSFLLNLLYLLQLATIVNETIPEAEKIKQILLPCYLKLDEDEYLEKMTQIQK